MVKRKLALALAIMMTFSFVGCDTAGGTSGGDTNGPSVNTPNDDNDTNVDDGHVHDFDQKVLKNDLLLQLCH